MKRGFTLIELVMIIVILGILAAVAIPKYFDLQDRAKEAAEKGVVGGVRAGLYTYFANYQVFPVKLDDAASGSNASTDNPFFTHVLTDPITADWSKGNNANVYVGPGGGQYWYNRQSDTRAKFEELS